MKPLAGRTFLWDLDGTLTDPREGITTCIRHALERMCLPAPEFSDLLPWIGPPLHESFLNHLRCPESAETAVGHFRERFSDRGWRENRVIPGMPGTLDHLQRLGARHLVATAKPQIFADRIIRHFRLDRWIDGVYGSELDGRFSDKRDLLDHLMADAGLNADRSVMIGDREHDIRAARHAGMSSVGVLWGFGDRRELEDAGADEIVSHPGELIPLLVPGSDANLEHYPGRPLSAPG